MEVSDLDSTLSEMQNMTQFEKQQLRHVVQQAKKFELEEERLSLRKRIEGNLLKFTNVVKGYQPRWFVLNSEAGLLEYYEKEEHKGLKKRGELSLTFASVTPSDEDSQTFSVNANNGEVFKLRASDAKQRQYWVNRIRAVAEFCSDQCKELGSYNPASLPNIHAGGGGGGGSDDGGGACHACDDALQEHHQQQQQQQQQQQHQPPEHQQMKHHHRLQLAASASSTTSSLPSSSLSVSTLQPPPAPQQHSHGRRRSSGSKKLKMKVSKSHSSGNVSNCGGAAAAPAAASASDGGGRAGGGGGLRQLAASLDAAFTALDSLIESLPLRTGDASTTAAAAADEAESKDASDDVASAASPKSPPPLTCLDRDLLAVRATALAALRSLEACRGECHRLGGLGGVGQESSPPIAFIIGDGGNDAMHYSASDIPVLQLRSTAAAAGATAAASAAAGDKSLSASHLPLSAGPGPQSAVPLPEMLEPPPFPVPHADDVPEEPPSSAAASPEEAEAAAAEAAELGTAAEEHKSVILHLLQQLKLGMDLTRVVLPTFILERRSLLEMFADSMLHPDLFLRAADLPDPEARMVAVLEWFLTSFHAGRRNTFSPKKGAIAKKPYNPLIGETFHCSWLLSDGATLVYTAEQVSHHPPVTAFYLECPQRQVWLNASIYTKSKFMGMSIGVSMIGRLQLHLLRHGEVYAIQLPSAYARSILTVPWVELGDKVAITCQQSRYAASVVFHTKPFYGGRLHRVSAEVRTPGGGIACRVAGEWSGQLEFDWPAGGWDRRLVHVAQLPAVAKRVRPRPAQRAYESRRLWASVTDALRAGDIARATEEKKKLEDWQRGCEKYRREKGLQFPVKYFIKDSEGNWIFKQPLQSGQTTTVA